VIVAILNYNGKKYLKECIESLKAQTYKKTDVMVIDNGSQDGSVDFLRENFPWVRVIAFKKNYGYAKAYNMVIASLKNYEFIVLLNMDTKVDKEWLAKLVDAIVSDDSVAACGSKVLFMDRPNIVNHAGGKFTFTGGYDIGFLRHLREVESVKGYTGWVNGCAMMVRRSIFLKVGGFDEDFVAYAEELDLCWRFWLSGYKILHVPNSIVYHKFGAVWNPKWSFLNVFLSQRNRLLSVIKNFETRNLVKALSIYPLYDYVRIVMFTRAHPSDAATFTKAIFFSYFWILKHLRLTISKRRIIQNRRKVSDDYLKKRGLLSSLSEGFLEFRKTIHEKLEYKYRNS
jgi:hypothetical protein